MTFRLLGLMTFVLLLSLAAFGLLMGHYQDRVMDEVVRTASEVGRATLQSLHVGTVPRSQSRESGRAGAEIQHEARIVTAEVIPATPEREVLIVSRNGERPTRIPLARLPEEIRLLDPAGPIEQGGSEGHEVRRTVVIRLDDVRAEKEAGAEGLLVRIPTVAPDGQAGVQWVQRSGGGGSAASTGSYTRDEFVFRVPTEEYGTLFSAARRRVVFAFLGVFVVGTVLSAGLASRFTLPIRRLDAAIHRLSEGDLDVTVEASGRGEVTRLGLAFNEMARKLRAGRERARELTRKERLSALGRLAAGVAHDVRNPLHSIGLTLHNLQETCRPDEPGKARELDRSLAIIRDEIARLDELIENFLRFARSDRGERVPVDLGELARDTARLVAKEAERRGVVVEVDVSGPIAPVLAHPESVRSAILNLVLNSFEAMSEGGRLGIDVSESGDEVRLEVSDTGRGIPEDELDRVFDFAYTTRDGGHGLGLAMVHQAVVEEHGGRVTLESRPGEGTRVILALPRHGATS